jgi:hypothetical protein
MGALWDGCSRKRDGKGGTGEEENVTHDTKSDRRGKRKGDLGDDTIQRGREKLY